MAANWRNKAKACNQDQDVEYSYSFADFGLPWALALEMLSYKECLGKPEAEVPKIFVTMYR